MNFLLQQVQLALAHAKASSIIRQYISHQKKRTIQIPTPDGVILFSFCSIPEIIHTYAELLPKFSFFLKATLVAFSFQSQQHDDPLTAVLYKSFGARIGLRPSQNLEIKRKAETRSTEIFNGLNSKTDVSRIRENEIILGDLIYDTYLRDLLLPTVDIRDPRLLGYIRDALIYLYSSEDYFSQNAVRAIFVDHLVYIWQGVPLRVAMSRNIPCYTVYYDPRPSAERIDLAARENGLEVPARFNYWLYPDVFAQLPRDEQVAAREKGKAYLEHRVSGGMQNNVLPGQSAFSRPGGEPVLLNTASRVPRILILLHDFCDAAHCYRSLLFDDFYEWINYLLREASQTKFDWYVKPHPNLNDYRRRGIHNSNQQVIEELKARYTRITFIDPSVSNRQLIDEGLAAVFTMYGTAAHEFPFLGIPAVCGADNPHVSYPFAHTPKTIDEYAALIHRAGSLDPVAGQDRIPEFCYMNYLYAGEYLGADTALFCPSTGDRRRMEDCFRDALGAATPEADRFIFQYVRDLLEGRVASCVKPN